MVDCLTRNLQRFVEFNIATLVRWDKVQVIVPVDGERNAVEARFQVDGRRFHIRVESSDLTPPLGRIELDDRALGPIDEAVWDKIADEVKSWHAKASQQAEAIGEA